jgi:hypothetical protein
MSLDAPHPFGEPVIRTVAMPADTNPNGDIFGGWLMAQMDLAGGIAAKRRAHGRTATVSVESATRSASMPRWSASAAPRCASRSRPGVARPRAK